MIMNVWNTSQFGFKNTTYAKNSPHLKMWFYKTWLPKKITFVWRSKDQISYK